mgnify:CR=1 FL=1
MRKIFTFIIALTTSFSFAQNNENLSATAPWSSFMNVFDLNGNYMFGDGWTIIDLKTVRDSSNNQIILYPNFNTYANAIASGDQAEIDYWTDNNGGGNKIMEASTFVEPGSSYNEQDLTFSGQVISNTISSDYEVKYFIKALDPGNNFADALGGSKVMNLPASGEFQVSATAAELASGLIIQYGFSVIGINANPDSMSVLGNVVIGPSTLQVEEEDIQPVSYYPNPTTDYVTIKNADQFDTYAVYSILGEKVASGKLMNKINFESFKKGVYFVNLSNSSITTSLKVIKK